MPEHSLESLLGYSDLPPAEDFIDGVMRRVKREQRTRSLILLVSGLLGGLFGVMGAVSLSGEITRFFTTSMDAASAVPVSFSILGVLVFLAWLFSDELTLNG